MSWSWSPVRNSVNEREWGIVQEGTETVIDLSGAVRQAIWGGQVELVEDLLHRREALIGEKPDLMRDLHLAVRLGHEPIVSLLLRHGAEADALDSIGRSPLHLACIHGHPAIATTLLEHGADISIKFTDESMYEHFALSFAARMGHAEVLRVLIRYGADVNKAGSRGLTALHYAAVRNQSQSIEVLVETGIDIEARVCEHGGGGTALHASAVMRCYDATLCLLRHGANIKAQNAFGYTPLHGVARQARKDGAFEVADLLLRWGGDETAVDHDGNTPLDLVGLATNTTTTSSSITADGDDSVSIEENNMERLRKLLKNAPRDRAWRRRGFFVLCRIFLDRVPLVHNEVEGNNNNNTRSSNINFTKLRKGERVMMTLGPDDECNKSREQHGERPVVPESTTATRVDREATTIVSGGFIGAVVKTLMLAEEGVFRKIVTFL